MTLDTSPAEINARASARGDLARWLIRRYGSIELVELADEPDPINLRQIFIPLRLSSAAIAEADSDEATTGDDAWKVVAEQRFLAISGLPGSGKSTLVKALISEICGSHESVLRQTLRSDRGIMAVPFVLREFGDLSGIGTLDQMLGRWFELLEAQNRPRAETALSPRPGQEPIRLDLSRLRTVLSTEGENFPALFLFDGIDEVGGKETRAQVLMIAAQAVQRGHRVVLTGRPSGFDGLELPNVTSRKVLRDKPDQRVEGAVLGGLLGAALGGKQGAALGGGLGLLMGLPEYKAEEHQVAGRLFHIAPLVESQIADFITRWHDLRPEWQGKRDGGISAFLGAIRDGNRPYLRQLARRPIFLTLMALVHCTRNDMPHGRVELYKAIIDNYLVRQDRHRQIKQSLKGKPMPHWPEVEKRLVLGYLAWESQKRRISNKPWEDRAIVWSRADMVGAIRQQVSEGKYGRFSVLRPEDAGDLVDYFLHPAGLVIEPVEGQIQFAHLSFQEYLCAEFLQGRLVGRRFEDVFRKDILAHLGSPGWDEVALQVFAIHADKTHNHGQFELIELLDIETELQARLLINVVTGREVPFSTEDRENYISLIVLCDFLHHLFNVRQLGRVTERWRDFVLDSIRDGNIREVGSKLTEAAKCVPHPKWKSGFASLSKKIGMWEFLAHLCDFALSVNVDEEAAPPFSPELRSAILTRATRIDPDYSQRHRAFIVKGAFTPVATTFDFVTQGEVVVPALQLTDYFPAIRFTTHRIVTTLPEFSLAHAASVAVNAKGRTLSALLNVCQLASHTMGFVPSSDCIFTVELYKNAWDWRAPLEMEGACKPCPRWRFLNVLSAIVLRGDTNILNKFGDPNMNGYFVGMPDDGRLISSNVLSDLLSAIGLDKVPINIFGDDQPQINLTLSRIASQFSGKLFFESEVVAPGAAERRGFPPGQPVPAEFGLCDSSGLPLAEQRRDNWVRLRQWLGRPEDVLRFANAWDQEPEKRTALLEEFEELRTNPESPMAVIDKMLAEWPEDQPVRVVDFDAITAELVSLMEEASNPPEKPKRKKKAKG